MENWPSFIEQSESYKSEPIKYFVLLFYLFSDVCGRRGGGEQVGGVLLDLDIPPVVCPHDPVPAVPDQGQGHQHHPPPHRAPQERHLGLLTLGQLPLVSLKII